MSREIEAEALTDEERLRLLQAAEVDEREGRLIHVEGEAELRALMARIADSAP